jgi:TetR/AcrR family transcriptional repressor of nem operon
MLWAVTEQSVEPEAHLTPKGRATRARIVAVAAQLMFEHGVVKTSIEDVRRAAGVSGSQMTHYFTDKHSLVRAVIAWQADTVIELHRQPPLGKLDSFAALRLWADLHVEQQKANECQGGCSFGSLAGELAEADDDTRADLAFGFERWEALFQEGLRVMRDRGELRADANPARLGSALLAAMQGGMLMTQTKRDTVPLEAALEGMLAYIESFATERPPGARSGRNVPRRRASGQRPVAPEL